MAQSCVYCGNRVVWADVMATEEGQRVAWRADTHGLLALSEHQQLIHMEKVCVLCVEQADALRRAYPSMPECECECGECGTVSSSYECPCCGATLF